MTAVIETGGKQYCVEPGSKLVVARLAVSDGETATFPDLLGGASVLAAVSHGRSAKVITRKFRHKTRYHRLKGQRQPITILSFAPSDAKPKSSAEPEKREA